MLYPYMYFVFCSWDIGHAHFVIFSTEVYFYTEYGVELIEEQYKWLECDLKVLPVDKNSCIIYILKALYLCMQAVNSRKVRPWVITAGHRPMYCSTKDSHDCNKRDSRVKSTLKSALKHTVCCVLSYI